MDLVSGSSRGGVQWAENVAGSGKTPAFESFRELIAPGREIQYGEPLDEADLDGPTGSTRVWVEDFNGDDKLDLLVGDSVTLIAPAEGLSEEEFKQKQAEWQKRMDEVSQEFNDAGDDEEKQQAASEQLQELYAQRSDFMTEDRTGFVWLYLHR
jgi:hypothetical protein